MDTGSVLSDTRSVTPSESVSQAPKNSNAPSKSGRGGPRKGRNNPSPDKGSPQGAVQVPKGGSSNTGKASPVISGTIPLSGWGEIDLVSHRKDIEPTFTTDARPYADLVDTVYQSIQARYSTGGKHIPRALFRYYCFQLWWLRALWLHKSNGNTLDTEQKNFLNILSAGEDFQVPAPIAQYLANQGNFLQGGEQFYYRLMEHKLVQINDAAVSRGWFETDDADNKVTASSFWIYSQLPSPGVFCTDVCNEAENTLPAPGAMNDLAHIAPANGDNAVRPTENIIGWSNVQYQAHHSSWRSTFAQLGWSINGLPADLQTQYNVSTSTMKWMSERLSTMRDFKLHTTKQITLSVQGHPMQAYWLGTETAPSQRSQEPPAAEAATNRLCGSRHSDLAVLSRYSIDSKILAPAFSFGYRLERSLQFRDCYNRQPRYWNMSNFQPWLLLNAAGTGYVQLTAAQLAGMNSPFNFGSQVYINVRRFATHELNRSVGLDAALVLSDTK
jgi:hypothetical protein